MDSRFRGNDGEEVGRRSGRYFFFSSFAWLALIADLSGS
jgi:hypothetical protein